MPLRIAVQQELFTKLLLRKNKTIKDTMNEIVTEHNLSGAKLKESKENGRI